MCGKFWVFCADAWKYWFLLRHRHWLSRQNSMVRCALAHCAVSVCWCFTGFLNFQKITTGKMLSNDFLNSTTCHQFDHSDIENQLMTHHHHLDTTRKTLAMSSTPLSVTHYYTPGALITHLSRLTTSDQSRTHEAVAGWILIESLRSSIKFQT